MTTSNCQHCGRTNPDYRIACVRCGGWVVDEVLQDQNKKLHIELERLRYWIEGEGILYSITHSLKPWVKHDVLGIAVNSTAADIRSAVNALMKNED
jgi:hypothetical protein